MLRDPVKRCVSNFYDFTVRRNNESPDPKRFLQYAQAECNNRLHSYYDMNYLPSRESIDFLGVTERMEETLLVLGHILGLGLGDLLFKATKVVSRENGGIGYSGAVESTEEVTKYFASARFRKSNDKDYQLLERANAELDRRIDAIGRDLFEKQLKALRKYQEDSQNMCKDVEIPCMYKDNGCAYECLNYFSNKNRLYQPLTDPNWRTPKAI
jgi:hypothetical protein